MVSGETGPSCTRYKWADDVVLLAFAGRVDMDTAITFRANLLAAIESKPRGIAVDLREINYMDSAGVAVMVEMLRWCKNREIVLVLVAPSPAARRGIEVMQVMQAFPLTDSTDTARDRFVAAGLLAPARSETTTSTTV